MKIACMCCKKTDHGTVVQCDFKNCFRSSYVRCAARKGWIYQWNDMLDDLNINDENNYERPIFCGAHREKGQ